MADVKWIKLSVSMFEDEKIRLIESLPEADTILIIWVKLLAQSGKTNASGYIYLNENIPYTDEMLATIFNRPVNIVRLALKTFENFGMIEITEEHFICISNWEKHQNIDGLEKIRLDTKKRVQRYREKQKLLTGNATSNVTETQGNETELEQEEELERERETITTYADVTDFYQQNFGVINSFISQQIEMWINDLNEKLVIEAMKRALAQQKKWAYAEGILKNWANENISSLDDVKALDLEFSKRGNDLGRKVHQHSRGHGRSTSEDKESITGGKIGRL